MTSIVFHRFSDIHSLIMFKFFLKLKINVKLMLKTARMCQTLRNNLEY